jgi:hypothetical protein
MLFLVVMLVLDGIYLYATRKASMDLIRRMQGPEKSPMRLGGAVFTYACMGALLYGFILRPKRSILEAFLLGFFVYGVYVAFCDDDDCWMPSKLEKRIAAMKDTGCGMSSTNGWMFHGAINTQVPYLETGLPKRWQRPFLSRTNYVICSSAVLRLDLGLRFAVMPDSEDYEMWKRVLLKTDLVYIDECLVGYDVNHGDGILYDKNYTPKRAPLKNWKMF